jgi:hypothetical protein
VIVRAVDNLPDDVHESVPAKAEAVLLDYARDFDVKHLRVLGKRILEVIDPDAADANEAKPLEREEEAARAAASFAMVDDGHGKTHGKFTIPSLHGAILKKALMAIAAPKHRAAVDGHAPVPGRPSDKRMGEAFMEYLERYPAGRLPKTGGLNATIVVTTNLDALRDGLKAAQLDTGERISVGEARRLACEAGIIPAVLGGKSKVLDLGGKKRFHSEDQRIVFGIEQGGCSELADVLGVQPSTLRHWDAEGLVVPDRTASRSERTYSPSDVRDARIVHQLRMAGYRIGPLKDLMPQLRGATMGGGHQRAGRPGRQHHVSVARSPPGRRCPQHSD